MKYKITIPIKITLSCNIKKKGKQFIAKCKKLNLKAQGETEGIARKNLIELINDFFFHFNGFFTLRGIKQISRLDDLYYKLY